MKIHFIPPLAAILDQLTKWMVRQTMMLGDSIPIMGDTIRFTHIKNSGLAFGINLGNYTLFTIISIVVAGFIFVYYFRMRNSRLHIRLAFALILAGAIGNLIDRIWFRGVTDFIDVNIPDIIISSNKVLGIIIPSFHLLRWPVFNIADACVTCGMIILFWVILFTKEKVL